MATTQDSNDRSYSDAEKFERPTVSRLILPAWITELERAALNPISIAPNSIGAGPPGSLSTGGVGADVSDIFTFGPSLGGDVPLGASNGVEAPVFINLDK